LEVRGSPSQWRIGALGAGWLANCRGFRSGPVDRQRLPTAERVRPVSSSLWASMPSGRATLPASRSRKEADAIAAKIREKFQGE
jgi:hypothetical protein